MLKQIAYLLLLFTISTAVTAQYDNQKQERGDYPGARGGQFEVSVVAGFQNSVDKDFSGGAQLDVDSALGWGFSLGWNWTENLNLSYRLLFTEPDYSATVVTDEDPPVERNIGHEMSKYSHQLNLTYHFMDGAFTPFAIAGIGVASVDSNVPNGSVEGGCWWDPWWGYVCFTNWETYTSSELAYNLGVGFRWDINTAVFTRGSYSMEFIDLDSGSLDFGTFILEMGLMF